MEDTAMAQNDRFGALAMTHSFHILVGAIGTFMVTQECSQR